MVAKKVFLPIFERAQVLVGTQSADGDKYYNYRLFIQTTVLAYFLVGLTLFAISTLMDPNATFYDYIEAIFPLMCAIILLFNFAVTVATRRELKSLFTRVGNFQVYGPPRNFEFVRKHLDAFIGFLSVYITVGLLLLSTKMLVDMESFRQLNQLQGRDVVCGFVTGLDYMLYDIKTGYLWYIHLVIQFYGVWAACFGGVMLGCGILISAELVVIRIQHLGELVQDCINSDYDDKIKKRKLNNCIRYHQDIIDIVDEINQVYIVITTPLQINYGLAIGLQVLSLLMKVTFRTSANALAWVGILLLACMLAERLIGKSSELATSIYFTDWYNLNLSMRKDILTMLVRAQKPLAIKSGPLGHISLKMFTSIMKRAYTYGTMKSGIQ